MDIDESQKEEKKNQEFWNLVEFISNDIQSIESPSLSITGDMASDKTKREVIVH